MLNAMGEYMNFEVFIGLEIALHGYCLMQLIISSQTINS